MEAFQNFDQIASYLGELKSQAQNDDNANILLTKSQKPQIEAIQQDIIISKFNAKSITENANQMNQEELERACDGRIKIEKPSKWPHSANCLLRMKFGSQDFHSGSATLIGPNLAITAAHNLYNISSNEEVKLEDLALYPGADGTVFPYMSKIIKFYYPKTYIKTNGAKDDFGLLILEKDIGYQTGFYGLCSLDKEEMKKITINITGYPCDKVKNKPYAHEMWGMDGNVFEIDIDHISYLIDTYGGQSGSGIVWSKGGNEYYVVGVHVIGDKNANKGTYLTKRRLSQIQGWLECYLTELALSNSDIITLMLSDNKSARERIKDLASNTSNIVNKECIDLRFNENITEELVNKLTSKMANLDQLKILKLDLESTPITKKALKQIANAIEDLENLNLLSLNLKSTDINDRSISQILSSIAANKNLASLSLDLAETDITDNSIEDIANYLKKHQNLSSFSLNMKGCQKIEGEPFKLIQEALSKNMNISRLYINCGETKVPNTSFVDLAINLKTNKKIAAVDLDIDYLHDLEDAPILDYQTSSNNQEQLSLRLSFTKMDPGNNRKLATVLRAIETLKKDPNMKDLKLSLTFMVDISNIITEDTILFLGAMLINAKNVENLDLDLSGINYSYEAIIQIGYDLRKMKNIQTLSLNLRGILMDDSFASITELFKNNPHIINLNLNLEQTWTSKSALFKFAEVLKDNESLHTLDLNVSRTYADDESMTHIANAIKNKTNLKNLILDFSELKIESNGILALAEAIQAIPNIEIFKLWLLETRIVDFALDQLSKAFMNQINLKEFYLNLHKVKISDYPVITLANAFKNMPNLNKISLYLNQSYIGDSTLIALAEALKANKNVNELEWLFIDTSLTDDSLIKLFEACKDNNITVIDLTISKTKVTDQFLEKIMEIVKDKTNLTKLSLTVSNTKITQKAKDNFKAMVKNCTVNIY